MTIPDLHHRLSDDLERMHRWCNDAMKEFDAMKDLAKGNDRCYGALVEATGHVQGLRRALSQARTEVERGSNSTAR
jgi:hypothetical protein